MYSLLLNDEVIMGTLERYPHSQWPRLIRVFTLYGIKALTNVPNFNRMNLESLENLVLPPQNESMNVFMKEIQSIKKSLRQLDYKIDAKIGSKTMPPAPITIDPVRINHANTIYPIWWGHPDSSRFPKRIYKKGKENLEDEMKYQHEMEVTAVAIDNARKNALIAGRNPIKMIFEKEEFSRPQKHSKPNPIIIEKNRKTYTNPPEVHQSDSDPLVDLRKSQSQFYRSDTNLAPVKEQREHYEAQENSPYENGLNQSNPDEYEEDPQYEEMKQNNPDYDSRQYSSLNPKKSSYENASSGSLHSDNNPNGSNPSRSNPSVSNPSGSLQQESSNDPNYQYHGASMVDRANNCIASKIISHFSQESGNSPADASESGEESEENSQTIHPNPRQKQYIEHNKETIVRRDNIYEVANSQSYTYPEG